MYALQHSNAKPLTQFITTVFLMIITEIFVAKGFFNSILRSAPGICAYLLTMRTLHMYTVLN